MNQHLWWYVARASGVVSWVLVSASVVFGLSLSLRLTRKPKPAWVLDLHRFLGGLSVLFVGVHMAGLVLDSYVKFGLSELFVPLASAWKPVPVAWGVVGLYLLFAVEVTSLGMRRLPRRFWRAVHFTSYAVFVLSTLHMFTAGTDASNPLLQWAGLGVTAIVGFLTVARMLGAKKGRSERAATARPRVVAAAPTPLVSVSADSDVA